MENLIIKPGEFTPEIIFDIERNHFSITGESRPENVIVFYSPVIKWLEGYKAVADRTKPLKLDLKLEYFNSSTVKYILKILDILKGFEQGAVPVQICWHYPKGDEDIQEAGAEFQKMTGLNFKYIEY